MPRRPQRRETHRVSPPHNRLHAWALALLALATILVFFPALRAPLQFDDAGSIIENATIRSLWPPTGALSPPAGSLAVSGRPVVNYSFAVNVALNRMLGIEPDVEADTRDAALSFHLVNILIHLGSGLLLFGVVRRTARLIRPAPEWEARTGRIALIATAIWLLHPIQTEPVNYVVQRTELLVSFFYLATVYCAIRAWDASGANARPAAWSALAITASLLGMGSKEVMITAPLAVLLYDRAFRGATWRELMADRRRRAFYGALVATSALCIYLAASGPRSETAGFHTGFPWYLYLVSQGWAIAHYLRLLVWPAPLLIDYGTSPIVGAGSILGLGVVALLLALTVRGWARLDRYTWLAFAGAWFFLLLGPSSSVIPIATEVAAERRVYLASAAVFVAVAVGIDSWLAAGGARARATAAVAVVAIISLGAATARRSDAFARPSELWRDVVVAEPDNPRAWQNLGAAWTLERPANLDSAATAYRHAITLDSNVADSWQSLAAIGLRADRIAEADTMLRRALRLEPGNAKAAELMGEVRLASGEPREATVLLKQAASRPTLRGSIALGRAYMAMSSADSAVTAFADALTRADTSSDALLGLGHALVTLNRSAEAVGVLERARLRAPSNPVCLALLSVAYAESGKREESAATARAAVALDQAQPVVFLWASRAMLKSGRLADAEQYASRLVQLAVGNPQAMTVLGQVERAMGNVARAEALYRAALRASPTYAPALQELNALHEVPRP